MAAPAEKKLSLFQQITYSTGNIPSMLLNQVIVSWAIYYYAPGAQEHGLEGAAHAINYAPIMMLGYAMGFGRLVDAVADPLIGYFSDRANTKWGRRIPFVALGTPFLLLFFIILWRPPVAGMSSTNTYYFALMLGGFFFFYTVVVAPYLSLMPEIARTNNERMSVATWEAVFGIVGLLIAAIGAPILIGKDFQFMKMALIMAAVSFVFYYISIGFVKESPRETGQAETFSFFEAMKETMKNECFISWVICIFMFWIGFNVIMMSTPYFVTKVLGETEDQAAIYQGIMMILTIPVFVGVFTAAKKISKKTLIAFAMLMLTAITPLFFFMKTVPEGIMKAYALALFALLAVPVAVLLVMANAIIADIVDVDEERTGRRREAMYFGMQGLVTKSAIAISSVIGTQLMGRFGMSLENPMGILLTGPFCAIFTFLGFLSILKYPLDK